MARKLRGFERVLDAPALFAVAYGDNTFVAVGRGGEVVASPDGVSWSNRSTAGTRAAGDLHGIAYGAGVVGNDCAATSIGARQTHNPNSASVASANA